MERLPREEVLKVAQFLRERGATEVYLFGSQREGQQGAAWDLDLAVRGIPKGAFFSVYGEAMLISARPLDLIDLDHVTPFVRRLLSNGSLEKVA